MEEKRKVSYEQGKEFADQFGMKFLETSAKTAQNVAEAFVTMTKEIISQNAEKEKAMSKNGKYNKGVNIFIDEKKNKIVLSNESKSLNTNGG